VTPDATTLLRQARGSVDKHRRIMVRTVNQAFRKGDAIAADRYGKQLERLKQLMAEIDQVVGA
jgi:hypothetical protein